MNTFEITTKNLDFDQIEEIIENGYKLKLSEEVIDKIQKCRDYLDKKMENQKEPIYGVTTGFGSLCNHSISHEQLSQLQKNLVMSHACGTGDLVPVQIIKLMLLLKIKSLS
ncbi:MAG: aromatic amino acid lyase, partial [Bacteroidales bacterium]